MPVFQTFVFVVQQDVSVMLAVAVAELASVTVTVYIPATDAAYVGPAPGPLGPVQA